MKTTKKVVVVVVAILYLFVKTIFVSSTSTAETETRPQLLQSSSTEQHLPPRSHFQSRQGRLPQQQQQQQQQQRRRRQPNQRQLQTNECPIEELDETFQATIILDLRVSPTNFTRNNSTTSINNASSSPIQITQRHLDILGKLVKAAYNQNNNTITTGNDTTGTRSRRKRNLLQQQTSSSGGGAGVDDDDDDDDDGNNMCTKVQDVIHIFVK